MGKILFPLCSNELKCLGICKSVKFKKKKKKKKIKIFIVIFVSSWGSGVQCKIQTTATVVPRFSSYTNRFYEKITEQAKG